MLDLAVETQVEAPLSPHDFGLPHDSWRPYQYDTACWAQGLEDIGVLAAPTGSGKTAYSAFLSHYQRTVALTHTKALQEQYGSLYSAYVLMGRGNYPCIYPLSRAIDDWEDWMELPKPPLDPSASVRTCDDCLYAEIGMKKCPYKDHCVYMIRKHTAMHQPFVCVNYAYWLASQSFREAKPDFLVFDEAHLASDITLGYVGTTIKESTRADWRLPSFPRVRVSNYEGVNAVLSWLNEATRRLREEWKDLKDSASDDPVTTKAMRRCENLGYKLRATLEGIEHCPEAWFVRSGPGVAYEHNHPVPGLVAQPLTARYHFPRLFLDEYRCLLMSATIGDFQTFSEELGFAPYQSLRIPSNFPPDSRPVYILDAPKLNYHSTESHYQRQAEVIAQAIQVCPPDWSGIIHVTRKKEPELLCRRLVHFGISEERLWIPPEKDKGRWLGTLEQVQLWDDYRSHHTGAIAVAWQFHEGYDGQEEKICIVAKVPFPQASPGTYEEARMKYSHKFYNQRTTWALQQMLGRTRRGRPEDYDTPEEMRGFVAIADGNWTRVKSYLDEDFVEAMRGL